MSGGVDSAVAAHLCAAGRRDRRGHARAVGRPRERRRAQLLLGLRRRPGALARPLDGAAALHDRPARRVPRRGGGAVHRRLRRRRDPEPVRRLQRPRAPRRDARARRPARRRAPGHRPLRPGRRVRATTGARCCASPPTRPRTRPTCWRRWRPRSLARMRFPLGRADASPRCARSPPHAGLPVASKADSQDLCFLAGTDRARFLARHGGLRRAAGRDRRPRRRGPRPTTAASTASPSASAAGSGSTGRQPLYVLDKDAASNTVTVGPRGALRTDRSRCAAPSCTAPAPGSTASSCATAPGRWPRGCWAIRRPGATGRLTLELAEPVDGAAPGQLACLMDGELVVGWGTISAQRA